MNSERELFLYELNGHGYHFKNTDWHDDWERFEDDQLNMAWEMWCASLKRQGYKLVPVDVLERAISHISIAMCHPNNTRNEEDIMHNDMVIIEKSMNGELYD